MQENVGNIDRWVRVAAGGALILGAARALGIRGAVAPALLFASGAVLLETALTRVCALNALLGVDTRRLDESSENLLERAGASRGAVGRADKDVGGVQRPPADS
jgi:hypothetical protein